MAYGKIKADAIIYDDSGADVEKTLASIAAAAPSANPTLTGTVTIPTASANDNTTKAASTAYVQTELGDYITTSTVASTYAPLANPALTGTVTAVNLTLSGNLQVNGTTTTVASSTMTVADKNIEIAKGAANDAAADGAGITIDSGDGDKTWNWVDATDAWTSSEHIHLATGKDIVVTSGKIGIGDTAPDALLSVKGDSNQNSNPSIRLKDGTDTRENWISNVSGDLFIAAGGNDNVYHSRIRLMDGNLINFDIDNGTRASIDANGVSDAKGNLRSIPLNLQATAYTLVASDASKHVRTSANVTIPNNVFAAGDAVTIINQHSSAITLTQASGLSLFNSADATTGNRTLNSRGMCTLLFTTASVAYITGAGLS